MSRMSSGVRSSDLPFRWRSLSRDATSMPLIASAARPLTWPERADSSGAAYAPERALPLEPRDVGHHSAVGLHLSVPFGEAGVELRQLVAALREPDGLRRFERDAVPVPGQLPGDRDHGLRVRAGERDDAR